MIVQPRTVLDWYSDCLPEKKNTTNGYHSFPFFTHSASWHFLSFALCLLVCLQVTHVFWKCFCLGLKFLIFYSSLSQSHSSPASLFHLSKPGPQSQARYDYILVVVALRGAMHTLFPESGLRGKHICKKRQSSSTSPMCLFGSLSCLPHCECSVNSSIFMFQRDFNFFMDHITKHSHLSCSPSGLTSVED